MSQTPSAAGPVSAASPLVEAAWLAERVRTSAAAPSDQAPPLRIVDLRWSPPPKSGREKYRAGHIPGAVFGDLDADLSQPGGPGRHPFPSPEKFGETLGRLGIGSQTHVVVYDEGPGAYAARLWFMLRAHGHRLASVLDGGLKAWQAAGLPVVPGEETPNPVSPPPLRLDGSLLVDRAHVKLLLQGRAAAGRGLLLDARAPERYRGEIEPLDARAGHIPGAINAPYAANLRSPQDPRLLAPSELRAVYERLGVGTSGEVVVSCGSGVTACHTALAMELAGLGLPKLYVGSFSEWSRLPEEPIATGAEPGTLG